MGTARLQFDGRQLISRRSFVTLATGALSGLAAAGLPVRAPMAQTASGAADIKLEVLDLSKFSQPTKITNKWLPMKPGMRYVYEGTTVEDDGKVVPHKIEINITDLVKVIAGVPNVVSYDLDYSNNELVEAELAFFAQDDEGNVWHFGQYPEEYEDGKFSNAPTWIHGYEGAHAGIMMKASPKLGTPSYSQGYGPKVDWTDRGTTHEMGVSVAVRNGKYNDVMIIQETARSEIDAFQLKYYAPGVGNIKVGWMGSGEKTKESLELVKVEQMGPKRMEAIRNKALGLEKSAYGRSKTVYAPTSPSKVDAALKRSI
jgi:hypothetical protein